MVVLIYNEPALLIGRKEGHPARKREKLSFGMLVVVF